MNSDNLTSVKGGFEMYKKGGLKMYKSGGLVLGAC